MNATTEEELVEQMAIEIWNVAPPLHWDRLPERNREEYRMQARAALTPIKRLLGEHRSGRAATEVVSGHLLGRVLRLGI